MGKADLHIHTVYGEVKDSILTPERVIDDVVIRNIHHLNNHNSKFRDVIAITDHDTIEGAQQAVEYVKSLSKRIVEAVPQVIIGEEISALEGHILAIDIREFIPPRMSAEETIDAIHAQGGLAIAAHPFTLVRHLNSSEASATLRGVGSLILHQPYDGVEVINGHFTEPLSNLFARYLTLVVNKVHLHRYGDKRFARLGSSDIHFPNVWSAYTEFPGTTETELLKAIDERSTVPCGRTYRIKGLVEGYRDYRSSYDSVREYCKSLGLDPPKPWEELGSPVLVGILNRLSYYYKLETRLKHKFYSLFQK